MKNSVSLALVPFVVCFFIFWAISIFEKKAEQPISIESSAIPLTDSGMPLPILDNKWKIIKNDRFTQYMELEHGWLVSKWEGNGVGLTFVPKPAAAPVQGQSQK